MIIDGNPDIRLVTEIILTEIAGWEPLIAASGEKELVIAQKEQPDAILLCVKMPGMDGMLILKQLKANPVTQSIPVILSKGEGSNSQILALFPITSVVCKPFDADELVKQTCLLLNWYQWSHVSC